MATAAEKCSQTIQSIKDILDQCKVAEQYSARSATKSLFKPNFKFKSKLEELHNGSRLRDRPVMNFAGDRDMELLDISDRKQAELANKLQIISQELADNRQNRGLVDTIKDTLVLSRNSLEAMNQAAIFRALMPATADKRFHETNDPVADSFRWILEGPDEIDDSGSGVFHIVGKPGCGKSTLIKYVATHKITLNLLQQRAGSHGNKSILSNFFWKLGTDDQKTMRERYASSNLTMLQLMNPIILSDAQVKTVFDRLLEHVGHSSQFKICLFIDGLDEFDELAESRGGFCRKFHDWSECGGGDHVKLCVSSRQDPPILNAFPSARRSELHALTYTDIEVLVHSKLESNPHFQNLGQADIHTTVSLQDSIAHRAEGVFVWVVFLLKWIEEELATGRPQPQDSRVLSTQHLRR
ncbi:hypothetical protein B0H63DRAFT_523936 [Podospora didyma]|uniref:Nephrocystin 3-like N-terminal domain-containing protein n=1 Tax=Podospora didyma TaxID=330526 RepID=A0AAE0TVL4_9PEZI|nr:hypothetical protein B0H63DRAFT_523936 [Podospora didyma]